MRRDESQPEQETGPMKQKTKVFVGMDVHKDSVMIAVLPLHNCGGAAGVTGESGTTCPPSRVT